MLTKASNGLQRAANMSHQEFKAAIKTTRDASALTFFRDMYNAMPKSKYNIGHTSPNTQPGGCDGAAGQAGFPIPDIRSMMMDTRLGSAIKAVALALSTSVISCVLTGKRAGIIQNMGDVLVFVGLSKRNDVCEPGPTVRHRLCERRI